MSHATYTDEERLLKIDKVFYISFLVFVILGVISYYVNFLTFFISSIIVGIGLLIIREYNLLKSLKYLKKDRVYKIKPKMSLQKKESIITQLTTFLLIILPLLALYLAPIPINLSIALGIVGGWPLSNLFIQFLLLLLENNLNGKIYSIIIWEEIDNEYYIKEYGYIVK
ncbi:hypothetical protein SJAV_17220 [Sulfurisphaera javensis]|uniref:Uncharacterized protein n=1 Tax=Sulfurisphaera javensis TaxID=2049879 RepID=A0AAT9GSJ4_9CREN